MATLTCDLVWVAQTLAPQARWVQLDPALAAPVMSDPLAALSEWYNGMLGWGGKARQPCTSPPRPLAPSDLVDVPMPTLCSLGMHLLAHAKNAKYLSRSRCDAASQASLQSIGEPSGSKELLRPHLAS